MMSRRITRLFVFAICVFGMSAAAASQKQELLELKNTIVNLVDALVEQGVITADQARAMQEQAAEKARVAAAAEVAGEPAAAAGKKVVRVPYVPEFVKDDIRNQVKQELRKEVTEDVTMIAKNERWGTKDALPGWISRLELFGGFRLRLESTQYDSENQPFTYPNFLAINEANSISGPDTFLNTTEDRERTRIRLRFGANVNVNDAVKVGFRLTTGTSGNPISMNSTLGDSFSPDDVLLDRAFARIGFRNRLGDRWLEFNGGRIERPFLATDLVWDPDVSFQGVAATVSHRFGFGDDLLSQDFRNYEMFMTLGGFALDNDELPFDDGSSDDKYLLGGQLGLRYHANNQSTFELAGAVYDYVNIVGKFNPDGAFGSTRYDWTAPDFVTKGNTMYPIRFNAAGDPTLFGIASDFTLVTMTGTATFSYLAPVFVSLSGEFVKNLGFDDDDVFRRTGVRVADRTNGWHTRLDVGWRNITEFGHWRLWAGYKYLQRDAVLDAYAESNFHGSGTDGKGWIMGGQFGLARNTWLELRYFSADQIDLAPLGVDIVQLDLNTRF